MGQAVHAPLRAHHLPAGAGRHANPAAGVIRQRTRLGCRGFRLNRKVASAPVCARVARCRKESMCSESGDPSTQTA